MFFNWSIVRKVCVKTWIYVLIILTLERPTIRALEHLCFSRTGSILLFAHWNVIRQLEHFCYSRTVTFLLLARALARSCYSRIGTWRRTIACFDTRKTRRIICDKGFNILIIIRDTSNIAVTNHFGWHSVRLCGVCTYFNVCVELKSTFIILRFVGNIGHRWFNFVTNFDMTIRIKRSIL